MLLTDVQRSLLRNAPVGANRNRLRLAFTLAGCRQGEAAEAIGMPASNLSDIVNGKYGTVTLDTAQKLSEFFGVLIEDLFPSRAA